MKALGERWEKFWGLVLDPWFLLFVIVTAASLFFSAIFKENTVTSNLLAVLSSITGGIAGGLLQIQMSKQNGENTLQKKGQSAVRNLSSIQTQIASLRSWVAEFSKGGAREKNVQLEEVDRHLSTMELHIRSGYEDWIDIIPQLKQEKEIQEKYEQAIMASVNELLDQKMQLAQAADAQEKKNLERQINKHEEQLRELKEEGRRALYSGIRRAPSPLFPPATLTCQTCSKEFQRDRTRPRSVQSSCPDCKTKEGSNSPVE